MALKKGHYATVKKNTRQTTHAGQQGLIVEIEGNRYQLQFSNSQREWFHKSEIE